jgi:hypothetical protein
MIRSVKIMVRLVACRLRATPGALMTSLQAAVHDAKSGARRWGERGGVRRSKEE